MTSALIALAAVLAASAAWSAAPFVMSGTIAAMEWMDEVRRRRSGVTPVQWAQALLFLAGAVRAGAPLDDALALLAERAPAALRRRIADSRWDRALSARGRIERMLTGADTAFARAALLLHLESGGRIGRGLETAAATLQAKGEMDERVRALTAQARASAWVVGLSPFLLTFAMWMLSPDLVGPLFSDPLGRLLAIAAGAASIAGLWLALRLSRVDA